MSNTLDRNRLTSKITRYGKVSTTMAGLAAKLAGEKFFGLEIEKEEHAKQLTQALGNLKGPLMKIGQILATIPDAIPQEYALAFKELQANAPPMSWVFVKRRMKAEIGQNWLDNFKEFDQKSSAAASLGQVHKATSLNNEMLACKLQYPDMRSAIIADLSQLKIIFSLYEKYDKAIKTQQIHEELSERLYEELDYVREAKHCKLYAHILKNERNIHVPEIVEELCTDRLLVTNWLEGKPLLDFVTASQEERNQIAMNMFKAWYIPLYQYGIIHGDPHLGNYSIREDLSLNLLDFGCVRIFPASFIGGVIDLYNALLNNNKDLAVKAYETWGFSNLSIAQIDTLNIWANFLYAPVLEDKIRPIGEKKEGMYGADIAQKVHKQLREVGGVNVPREFVFMDRAALGLGSVFLHLKAEINWHRVFNELIQGFNVDALAKKQSETLKKFDLLS